MVFDQQWSLWWSEINSEIAFKKYFNSHFVMFMLSILKSIGISLRYYKEDGLRRIRSIEMSSSIIYWEKQWVKEEILLSLAIEWAYWP